MPNFERLPDTDDYNLSSERHKNGGQTPRGPNLVHHKSKGALATTYNSNRLPPSPADSMMAENNQYEMSQDKTNRERDRLTNHIDRGAPGDAAIFSDKKTSEQREAAKRRSQYYNDEFAYREPLTTSKERAIKESIVMAEVKTNVIVNDEYTFITDLSYQLSDRYQRPESSILISVNHSACMLFAGSFEPAYALTITALPSLLQPMTNRRNAALLQKVLEEALGVPASRGIVKFIPVPEENYAYEGNTIAGHCAELERTSGEASNIKRSASRASKTRKRSSMRSMRNLRMGFSSNEKKNDDDDGITPPGSLRDLAGSPPIPPTPGKSDMDRRAERTQQLSKRKSFMSIFNRKDRDGA